MTTPKQVVDALDTIKQKHGFCDEFDVAVAKATVHFVAALNRQAEEHDYPSLVKELDKLLNPAPKIVLEHREGEYVHLLNNTDRNVVLVFVDGEWIIEYNEDTRPVGYPYLRREVEWWVTGADVKAVVSHGFLTGTVSVVQWAVGDVVPARTVLDREWLGGPGTDIATNQDTKLFGPRHYPKSSSSDRTILWIEGGE